MRNPLDKMEYPVGPPAGFGKRNINVPGASTNHQGIDIGAPKGTPVYAVADGSIVGTTNSGAPGISTLYQIDSETRIRCNHFSERLVDSGKVKQGDVIGLVGSTGASGGNHLHFAVYKFIRGKWEAIDPVPWLKENVNSEKVSSTTIKDEEMLAIYEGPDTNAAKKWVDLRTGKAIRTVTRDEMAAVRAQRSLFPVLIVTLNAAEWKAFNK